MGTVILVIFLILIFSFLLIYSADMLVVAVRRISKASKAKMFAFSAIILALGTSFPELSVAITSGLQGASEVSLGDVTGSNIANISLVAGFAALFVGKVKVAGGVLKKDIGIAFIAGVLPVMLMLDGGLSRVDGLILLMTYFAYTTAFFKSQFDRIAEENKQESFAYKLLRKLNHIESRKRKEFARLFVGLALMLFSADVIVRLAKYLASAAGVESFVVGLVIVAVGTSLPELAFSFRALRKKEGAMFYGNLLGSTIANSTLVIGVASIINPIGVAFGKYVVSALVFIVVYMLFWMFVRSNNELTRREAGILVVVYILFVIAEFAL